MKGKNSKTILIVEDDPITALSQKRELEQFGYKVVTTSNGEEAIELCKNNNRIDLVLMDINLGIGIDGTEAAKRILKNREIPILFLSSHTDRDIVEKTEQITSYGYVVKHSDIIVLDASIKMAFKLFSAHREIENNLKKLQISEERCRSLISSSRDAIFCYEYDPPLLTSLPIDKQIVNLYHGNLSNVIK